MGTGSNSTQKTIEASRRAEVLGADAILVVVPYYNKPPQRGLYEHFKAVAASVKIPVILYNVPGRTITSLATETIGSLSKISNIVGIKEASGKIDFASDIIKACGKDFAMLSGDDGTYVEFLGAGGHGVISVATHIIPAQMVQWKKWVQAGELEKARTDIKKYSKLIDALFMEANPIPVKKALQLMGIIESGELRLPMVELEQENTEKLKAEMKSVGVI
jgi:4-hydroxy-tetrahydrodipicolinate synthase